MLKLHRHYNTGSKRSRSYDPGYASCEYIEGSRKMTTVAFITLGCKVNQYDSDVMKTSFFERGYSIVEFSEKADVYVVNTCTVTGIAAQ